MPAADRLSDVLDAAYTCLTRYGVRRTTVDDIATEAGISRSAVYLYVRNKDDAFRRLAERLHTQALDRARQAAAAGAPPGDRIRGVLAAKLRLVLDLGGDSPHTAELLDARARLFGDICRDFTADLRTLLAGQFAAAGTPDPARAADICIALVVGLEGRPDAAELFEPAVAALLTGLLPSGAARHHHPPHLRGTS
ncbi:TetR/AcrR family transcriptional regulator [Kitasatospora sp. NPDC058170]|uniref:TetR/AcrR family transcriptional regulator n=1 Tax=Kitasatospora sp. NPDC058170 TaxID=3346364 RepID=UPI0036D7D2F2